MKKYYVIGGQYTDYCYGGTDSLHAAKILASQHEEYWDNWQGWHKPCIYTTEQVIRGDDGAIRPNPDYAGPEWVWNTETKRWEKPLIW